MKIKYFPVCIVLMTITISYFLLNAFFYKNSNDSVIYLGIKDKNGWTDDLNLFRVPFKWESGTWVAMPNFFSTHKFENMTWVKLPANTRYPEVLTFPPSIVVTKKNGAGFMSRDGAYELPSDHILSTPVLSTNPGVVPKKATYGVPTDTEKQKIAPLLKAKVPTYTRADKNEKPIGKVELHLKDFIFKKINVDGYTFVSASLNRDLFELVFYEGYFEPNGQGSNPTGEFISHWYAIINNIPVFLGTGLEFLECADYANNNTSQFIFRISGYNRDGYRLFYNDFKDHVDFTWCYH